MSNETVAAWQPLGALDEFIEDEPAMRVVGNTPVAVFRIGDDVFALHDLCTHGHARLSEGFVEDGCVECPLHQGRFDIRTGAPQCPPVTAPVRTYPIRIVDARVEIHVDG
ncbi:anthranilate 1,2-dioxygenase ferredoxin subunit AndAb [Burkholderia singularis]|uniref:Ferredoxin subunits of nitrite reductase and ring-hydroxylating dioxygenases n=1 Tax=Burkholderia singularis TaxID=1503053 RepID=A0A238H2B5_9BURK|nr:anthranilate 1,2-dioxygenase ferredoxin subunit AndAb [Burkholderia singularis]SMF99362.1 Ferredoxin subunits of nitrite reductase and ring-hydroxylating dioxygenases [Burkholderia singularis]